MTGRLLVMLVLLVIVVPVIVGCQASVAPSDISRSANPTKGNPAPDFQLKSLEGQTVSLDSLKGTPVVLNFWATWCYWCRVEMPYLQQIHDEWSDRGLVLLAINVGESTATARQFLQNNNLSLSVLMDGRQDVTRRYHITGYPTTFFIDKDGIIQRVKIGAFLSKEEIEQYLGSIFPD